MLNKEVNIQIQHVSVEWYGMVWYGMVWYGMVWYGMVWYGMVWYGMVWYGMVWYGMVWTLRYNCSEFGACHSHSPKRLHEFEIFRKALRLLYNAMAVTNLHIGLIQKRSRVPGWQPSDY